MYLKYCNFQVKFVIYSFWKNTKCFPILHSHHFIPPVVAHYAICGIKQCFSLQGYDIATWVYEEGGEREFREVVEERKEVRRGRGRMKGEREDRRREFMVNSY